MTDRKVNFSDEILRRVAAAIRSVDDQFQAFELVEAFDLKNITPYELLTKICKILVPVSGVRAAVISFEIDGRIHRFATHPRSEKRLGAKLDDKQILSSSKSTKSNKDLVLFTISIDCEDIPKTYITFIDHYLGGKSSSLHQESTRDFLRTIKRRFERRCVEEFSFYRQARFQRLAQAFLNHTNGEGEAGAQDGEATSRFDEGWNLMLDGAIQAFPNYKPFWELGDGPRWQLLTVEKGRKFLNLRAENDGSGKAGSSTKSFIGRRFEAARTLTGLALEREDRGYKDDVLFRNPKTDKEAGDRFAQLMWDKSQLPESVMIIPIRNENGMIGALINVEHLEPHVFNSFQAQCVLKELDFVSSFAKSIERSRKQAIDREKELRYLLFRIISKLSYQYQHRTKNEFAKLKSALKEAELSIGDGDLESVAFEVQEAQRFTKILNDSALHFDEKAGDFIRYTATSVRPLMDDLIRDCRASASENNADVKITYDSNDIDETVFCSGLISEHLYSVVQNSLENFAETKREFLGASKFIEIRLAKREGEVDRLNNLLAKGFVEIVVRDNGGGIAEGMVGREFEFGQSTKARGKGSGLATARSYMRRFGGDVELTNSPGEGVAVTFRVPIFDDVLHEGMAEELNLVA
ncbi:MAG: HAMP domain-containing sensor histidine kinase [Rhodobacter sp.]|nr:HAMP domain-containing sensor histidine kinase [Rhodobacter sp.]